MSKKLTTHEWIERLDSVEWDSRLDWSISRISTLTLAQAKAFVRAMKAVNAALKTK